MAWGDLNAVTITGDFTYPDGTGTGAVPTGTVTFDFPPSLLSIRDPASNLIVVPRRVLGRLDASGLLKLPSGAALILPASDDPDVNPTGWTYHVIETITAGGVQSVNPYDITVPVASAGGTLDLADITQVTPLDGFSAFVTQAAFDALAATVAALAGGSAGGADSPSFSKAGFISVGDLHGPWSGHVGGTIVSVIAVLRTPPVGQAAIFDIQKNGTTIFTTSAHRPTIAAGGSGPVVMETVAPDVTTYNAHDVFTASVIQTGLPGTEGSDLFLSVVKA